VKIPLIIWCWLLLMPFLAKAQFRLAANIKAELSLSSDYRFHVSASTGITQKIDWVTPYAQVQVNLINSHLGSPVLHSFRNGNNNLHVDLIFNAGLNFGWGEMDVSEGPWIRDLNPFNAYTSTSLANDYRNSFLLGTNWALLWLGHKTNYKSQTIGSFGFSIDRFSLMYYNDGGPGLSQISLGDGRDRWWTGGFNLRYYDPNGFQYEVSFNKYTGFIPQAYEISNALKFDYVMYKNPREASVNLAFWRLKLHTPSGFGIGIDLENFDSLDFQNWLHTLQIGSFHPSLTNGRVLFTGIYNSFNYEASY
jgi:hypothetical protein